MKAAAVTARLGAVRILGYGIGDFGYNFFYAFATLFLLYYYTDILKINAAIAGTIIMAALIVESVLDPVAGAWANQTRSRYGRYRPWILYGALPLGLSFAAMFQTFDLTGTPLIAYVAVTHLIFRVMYTFVSIPYSALASQMTADSRERSTLLGTSQFFALGCGLLLAASTLPLVARFGGGRTGFAWVGIVYALAAALVLLACFTLTREDVNVADREPSLREAATALWGNRPFHLVMGGMTFASIGWTSGGKTLVYYMKYIVGSEALVTQALTVATAASVVALPLWVVATPYLGKRNVWVACSALSCVGGIVWYLAEPVGGPLLWGLIGLSGVTTSGIALTFWSAVADTVEFGQWKTGVRAEGAMYGVVTLSQKVALGIGIGVLGVLLDLIGYRANVAQSPATIEGIRVLVALVPAGCAFAGGLLMWFYPIDWTLHARLCRALARQAAVAARTTAAA